MDVESNDLQRISKQQTALRQHALTTCRDAVESVKLVKASILRVAPQLGTHVYVETSVRTSGTKTSK